MAKFTGPLTVGPWQSATDNATIDTLGTATFAGGLSGITIVNATTTAVASAVPTGGGLVPSTAAYAEISLNGTTYLLPLFNKG